MSAVSSIRSVARVVLASGVLSVLVLAWPGPSRVAAQAPASEEAQLAQELAWDENAPGPKQPIPFSHALHAGTYEIECLYCHTGTDRSAMAGVPAVKQCMGCHLHVGGELKGVQMLKEYWEEERPIEWVQIHRLPEHVQFRHDRHVAAGVECQRCHGAVEELHKLHLVPDTVWWPWTTPADKLEMGWCIQCHRENNASDDCLTCHY